MPNGSTLVKPVPVPIAVETPWWPRSRRKRIFDLLISVPLTAMALPIMAAVAVAVKLTSRGPAIFKQERCGCDERKFEVFKFRTMRFDSSTTGPRVTRRGDSRVTPLGCLLRRWKLDELPQLFNVIRGDMSLVGPRPDLPEYLSQLEGEHRAVLALIPGITGAATIQFRNEEEVLSTIPPDNLEHFYVKVLLPQKIALELEYAQVASLRQDALMLLRTAMAILR